MSLHNSCKPTKEKFTLDDWYEWDIFSGNSDAQCHDTKTENGNKKLINTSSCDMCPYNVIHKNIPYEDWELKKKLHKLINPTYKEYL